MTGDLDLALTAADAAGQLLLTQFRDLASLTVQEKRAGDFVSQADHAAEALLRKMLLGARPGDGWLGEETGALAPAGGRRWIVDPLDGTTNFLRGIPHWCISVALEVEGRPVLGVVHDPVKGETFSAAPGGVLCLNGQPVLQSHPPALRSALFGTGIPFGDMAHIDDHAAEIARLAPLCAGVRRMGAAALDLAYVAAGRLDGFWERRLRPWDVAAGLVLMQAADVRVESLLPDEDPWASGTILAAAPGLFGEFAGCLRG